MSQRTIIFSSPEDVLNFVRTVEKYPYDMDLESGRAVCSRCKVTFRSDESGTQQRN